MAQAATPEPEAVPAPAPAPKPPTTGVTRPLTDEEINAKIFRKGSKPDQSTVMLPIYYESMERSLGQVKAVVTQPAIVGGEPTVEVEGNSLFPFLRLLVVESWVDKFRKIERECEEKAGKKLPPPNDLCLVPFATFKDDEVKVTFDYRALEIRVQVPPNLRTPKTASLTGRDGIMNFDVTDNPAWLSSYVNMNFSQVFESDNRLYKNGREPYETHFDSGSRFGPLIVEADGRYIEPRSEAPSAAPPFVRENVRGIFDFPASSVRMQFGDISYPIQGFQVFQPLGGVSMYTQFSLQPSRLTLPSGSYEVFLERPSKVMVFLNDHLVQILELPAGRHNLRDFPFSSGMNDLRLDILDDLGRTESLNYSYFSNSRLLKPGLHEMAYAAGSPSQEVEGVRKYDSKRTTYTFFHRYGFGESLTLGLNGQMDPDQKIAGGEMLLSTKSGLFGVEPAYSMSAGRPSGYAARLRYIYQDYIGKLRSNRSYGLELLATSETFSPLRSPNQKNTGALKIIGTFSRGISKSVSANGSINYQFNRQRTSSIEDGYSISAGLSKRWQQGLTASANFRHSKSAVGTEDIGVFAFVVWAFPAERQVVTASGDSTAGSARADWAYQPRVGVGGVSAQAHVEQNQAQNAYGGMFDYTGNKFRANVAQKIAVHKKASVPPQPDDHKSVKTTNFRLGTALVYAGGYFSMSRPVTDSFAILAPRENLRGQRVKINPQADESYLAETNSGSPGVISEMPSYNFSSIRLNQKDLKPGTAMPRDHFMLVPPFHGGYAIEIGSDALVYLKATLLKADGTPLTMVAGQAVYLDKNSIEPVTVFTNRSGLIRSEGFRPGRYRLDVDGYAPFEFTIPKTASDDYDLGNVTMKVERK